MTESAEGARAPTGATGTEAARWVRRMFSSVADRYDLLNHVLSLNVDRWWRWKAVRRLREILARPGVRVADLCCGTGDLALAMQRRCAAVVLGCDFSHEMLRRARKKAARRKAQTSFFEADALQLPLADSSLDLVTAAFGFRNLADYQRGLREILRVLKPGGTAAILEFSQPGSPLLATLYRFYSRTILPFVGGLISGSREAYRYLPESVQRFPAPEELAGSMRREGFRAARYEAMTGGIVVLHLARK
ncbi:MAG: bifunctional demethylmenaquinone methyltransferase/2-methoxy-6-polyprenyl-1,4-benzoquinol methylase UbiE [Bryobacteraceae bacterium]